MYITVFCIICWYDAVQRAVGVDGLLSVLGSLQHDVSSCRGSALWRHLATWFRDVADSIVEQRGTSFDETVANVVLSWLRGATDCCHGE